LTRRPGGWPLTVFLTPDDHCPFFAGTYFPPSPRHGLPGFRDLLRQIENAYREQGEAISAQNASLRSALAQLETRTAGGEPDDSPLLDATRELARQFDARYGGFGGAPKFPHPGTLRFLLREGQRRGDQTARHMALHTLEQMARGGINDHLGGGFCRYSVDQQWMIPHFEKMLYDNGQLLAVFAEAWVASGHRPLFRHVCERIADWLLREMQSPLGGYYASLDADSEGEEGRFYVWTPAEVVALLDPEEYRVFAPRFGLDRAANFGGAWHLHVYKETSELEEATGLGAGEIRQRLLSARNKLLAEREKRVRPGRDEKILTSWNALMIKGMAAAGRLMERSDWIDSADHALRYLMKHHWHDGRLLATSRDGAARLNAYLDDYAYLIDAILALLQARWRSEYLQFACELAECLIAHFEDPEHGGFFFTSVDHEALVYRPKPLTDDAMPSGNGVAVEALQTLAQLVGDARLQAVADRALRSAWPAIEGAPYAHIGLLEGLQNYLEPPEQLIIRGVAPELEAWQKMACSAYVPGKSVFSIPLGERQLPQGLEQKSGQDGQTLAYRCRGSLCEPAILSSELL
jgi:uncharacterized protein YyaL (SSP411 family)